MGGARMHATISGCGDQLAADDTDAIEQAKQYFSYLPLNWRSPPPTYDPLEPARDFADDLVPARVCWLRHPHDRRSDRRRRLLLGDQAAVCPELVTGFALLEGEVIGIVANQPAVKGGVLFVDSADKGARFIWQCDAFSIPLLYLADVPGFMIGSAVERQGIIRHGAKMITAVAEATVPTVSLIIRKAYGAGLYAMAGPGFGPDACLALPTAKIAVMGPGLRSMLSTRTRSPRSTTRRSGRRMSSGCGRSTRSTSTSCGWPVSVVDAIVEPVRYAAS